MLETLKIKNLAVIDSAEIQFKQGLNILSGETGAGKSIVLEAISLLLGSRASADLIRAGCEEALVEGLFDLSELAWMKARLEALGFGAGADELLIKRSVHRSGKHRIHVNGELATLAILQELCEGLIDLCGQHEHQSLTKPAVQLELLDRYGGLDGQAKVFGEGLQRYRGLLKERDSIASAEAEQTRQSDFLKFKVDELEAAALEPGEDVKLQAEKQLLQSSEARANAAEAIRRALEDEEAGALQGLKTALLKLKALLSLDPQAEAFHGGLDRAFVEAEEVALQLNRYLSGIHLESGRLEEVQSRLALIANLRRKYGENVGEMLTTLTRLRAEAALIEKSGERLQQLSAEIEEREAELRKLAKKLSTARRKISVTLSESVTAELKELRMGDARFEIAVEERKDCAEWNPSGADQIQFIVQTNRGEPARPLGKIASGGELSRLMLSIRRVISDRGGIGVYLFDEIDAGIGGQTAFQVGKKLRSVAAYNQVICITHLPQVASFANHHWVVRKQVSGKRTLTEVVALSKVERREELARMLGGPELTKKSLENAAELLELAK